VTVTLGTCTILINAFLQMYTQFFQDIEISVLTSKKHLQLCKDFICRNFCAYARCA